MRIILNNGKYLRNKPPIDEFIFKINTTLGNGTNNYEFQPTLTGTSDYDIDWGDGIQQTNLSSSVTHTYSNSGIYLIKVLSRQGLTKYNLNQTIIRDKLIDVVNWGSNSTLTNFSSFFYNCSNINSISATDAPNLTNVTTFHSFLRGSSINHDFSNWDFSNATNFTFFALSSTNFNSKIGNNDLSNMTIGSSFFQGVTTNTSSLSNLKISGNCSYFFYNTSNFNFNSLTDLDFSGVTNATGIFQNSDFSNQNYQNFLIQLTGWNGTTATKTLQNNVPIHFANAKYEIGGQSEDVRNYLINTLGWTITDGGGI